MSIKQVVKGAVGAEEVLTVSSTVVALTAAKYQEDDISASGVYIRVENADIWFTVDGETTPSTSGGTILKNGEATRLDKASDVVNFRAIRTGSIDAKISVTYNR